MLEKGIKGLCYNDSSILDTDVNKLIFINNHCKETCQTPCGCSDDKSDDEDICESIGDEENCINYDIDSVTVYNFQHCKKSCREEGACDCKDIKVCTDMTK